MAFDGPLIGGRYKLGPRLGKGSQGEIHIAQDQKAKGAEDREVVVKRLMPRGTWKSFELFAALRRLRSAFIVISGERSLDDAYAAVGSRRGILPTLIDAAMLELHLSSDLADKVGIKERIATRLARLEVRDPALIAAIDDASDCNDRARE